MKLRKHLESRPRAEGNQGMGATSPPHPHPPLDICEIPHLSYAATLKEDFIAIAKANEASFVSLVFHRLQTASTPPQPHTARSLHLERI